MSSLPIVDAVLKRVRYYNPDLDISVLWLDEEDVLEGGLHLEVVYVRSALVARIADVVRQSSLPPSALDAAVSMAEVLVSSYGAGAHPGNGHNHAIQAISLLAMSQQRFDAAVDLFFDLVDRFCARIRDLRSDDDVLNDMYADAYAMRTLQNYDQTFVKMFLSKQWRTQEPINLDNPLQRIKSIRRDNELQQSRALACVRSLSGRRSSNPLFSDSMKVLRMLQRRRTTDAFKSKVASGYKHGMTRSSNDTAGTSSTQSSRNRSVDRSAYADLGVA